MKKTDLSKFQNPCNPLNNTHIIEFIASKIRKNCRLLIIYEETGHKPYIYPI